MTNDVLESLRVCAAEGHCTKCYEGMRRKTISDLSRKGEILPPCRHCGYCKQIGRQNAQSGRLGRKRYYCNHPRVHEQTDKHGRPVYPFIGFGDMTVKSPLVLKTRKYWCPLKEK